jgi:glycolate oxidase
MAISPPLDRFLMALAPFGDRLRTDAAARQAAGGDASHVVPGLPDAVVWPDSTAEVAQVAAAATAHHVALVPRGAGTGKAGGCTAQAGEVVIDLSRLNRIVHMAPADLYAVVQPGVLTADLDRAAHAHGLMYPPDPASWDTCSIGGNIATNAGGPRAVKYGVTGRYVWGLEVVLASGKILRMGRQCIKGVAGLEMTGLFVGSEGTLGIITEATMHLVPAPGGVQTAWMSFADPHAASAAASRMLAAGILPRMLELLDGPALRAVAPRVDWAMPAAGAALLVETDGATEAAALQDLVRLGAAAGVGEHCLVAPSEADREAMRRTRRLVSAALKAAYPAKVSDDITMPRSRMPELLDEAVRLAATVGLEASTYGHLGDGNLHINLLCADAAARQRTPAIRLALYRFALARGGTISGEHGIGLSKREALPEALGATLFDVQRQIKACLDPQGILNPGKVFGDAAAGLT